MTLFDAGIILGFIIGTVVLANWLDRKERK